MVSRPACPDCGHVHAGPDLGSICIGCPCLSVPAITGGWSCEAYGGRGVAECFVAAAFDRACTSAAECAAVMAAERRRVFQRINELAAGGDVAAAYLAETFTGPDQLLGGPAD